MKSTRVMKSNKTSNKLPDPSTGVQVSVYIPHRGQTCRLSCIRSASLLARAVSRMLACSRSAVWDCPSPASFPRSCSSSNDSFLLCSSRRRILFLNPRDSWSFKHINKKMHYTQLRYRCSTYFITNTSVGCFAVRSSLLCISSSLKEI